MNAKLVLFSAFACKGTWGIRLKVAWRRTGMRP